GRPAIVVQHHHRRPPASDVGRREGEGERRQEGWSPGPGRGTTVRQEAARHGRLRPRARARQIVTTLRHIKDKAHKDGQKKTEQAISRDSIYGTGHQDSLRRKGELSCFTRL
uniref:Uncharacterized protein n=1 Tax=Aegilops tauschii subsp. strangulata TaxID=200361 RepID=A0A453MEN8_AEGTS